MRWFSRSLTNTRRVSTSTATPRRFVHVARTRFLAQLAPHAVLELPLALEHQHPEALFGKRPCQRPAAAEYRAVRPCEMGRTAVWVLRLVPRQLPAAAGRTTGSYQMGEVHARSCTTFRGSAAHVDSVRPRAMPSGVAARATQS
jgi:hypothetical protein